MVNKIGEKFTDTFQKYLPNAFVFAILLTLITAFGTFIWLGATPLNIIESWYDGFFDLLPFAMQIVLLIITGYSIALTPIVKRGIDNITKYINTPGQVYLLVVFLGMLLSMVSFSWIVITSVLARELAIRVKGVNYPYLVACVYFSLNSWVMGLSSTIPLYLSSEKGNILIAEKLLSDVIPTSHTLGSSLNIAMMVILLVGAPLLMMLLRPKSANKKELSDLLITSKTIEEQSIEDEASSLKLPFSSLSDKLNNSPILQLLIVAMGLTYIIFHFSTKGFELGLNIMIFIFLIIGMLLHKTPLRYAISMKRSSSNISGILFQYPFYAGVMGIMLYTGLGNEIGQMLASVATVDSYPFYAYITGGIVNFAIPSAGGEFNVVAPSLISAIKEIGSALPEEEITAMISRASMSVAYGETLSNMLQPFYLLMVMPVMAVGTKLQARDLMGYLAIPFVVYFIVQSVMVVWWPL